MQEAGAREERFPISFFDGINSTVSASLSKRTELSHAENVRAPQIGVIEKREGQTVYGKASGDITFSATANYGLIRFPTSDSNQAGVFRISISGSITSPSVSVSPSSSISGSPSVSASPSVSVSPSSSLSSSISPSLSPSVSVSPSVSISPSVSPSVSVSPSASVSTSPSMSVSPSGSISPSVSPSVSPSASVQTLAIYALSTASTPLWEVLGDSDAQTITEGQFDSVIADRTLILVNKNDANRLIKRNGSTVLTSADVGDLYNSPDAAKVCFYKNRIYLADYVKNSVAYPTSVIRSSFPLGIIALVNGDSAAHTSGASLDVTDTKYFYSDAGMNEYNVYRGGTLVATITVTAVNESSITVSHTGTPSFLSSDEIWVSNTFDGEKQYRWVNNPTSTGQDVKQYDTFKLSGGEGDSITLFETVGNVIMMGNKYSLATWDDYTLQSMDMNIGCASSKGSAKMLGTLFFIHYSGIYSTTGGVPTLLSRKISRYIEGATKSGIEDSAAGIKGLSIFFTIGDVTLYKEDGSIEKTLSDVCLEYSVKDQNWYVHTNVSIDEFLNFISSDGVEHLLGTRNAGNYQVVDFLSGSTDLGREIFFRADTQEIQLLQEIETFANPIAIVTEVQRGSQMKCFVSADKAEFYELDGDIKKGVSTIKVNSPDLTKTKPVIARKLKVSYRDSSKQRCRISQMAIIYLPSTMDEPAE